jgi:hypothetical protein
MPFLAAAHWAGRLSNIIHDATVIPNTGIDRNGSHVFSRRKKRLLYAAVNQSGKPKMCK